MQILIISLLYINLGGGVLSHSFSYTKYNIDMINDYGLFRYGCHMNNSCINELSHAEGITLLFPAFPQNISYILLFCR